MTPCSLEPIYICTIIINKNFIDCNTALADGSILIAPFFQISYLSYKETGISQKISPRIQFYTIIIEIFFLQKIKRVK